MKYTIALFVILFLSSCDQVYDVDFNIINESSETLVIVSKQTDTSLVDTSKLIIGSSMAIATAFGKGMSSDDYAASLEVVPIDSLEIMTGSGKIYKYEELERQSWLLTPGDSQSD